MAGRLGCVIAAMLIALPIIAGATSSQEIVVSLAWDEAIAFTRQRIVLSAMAMRVNHAPPPL
jgi:hypothetical protein